jgi:polysaccharide export outer membrane protein
VRLAASILGLVVTVICGVPSVAQPAGSTAADARMDEYTVGVEDVLRVFVWGEPELSVQVQVRPDGKITVPLVHDIAVKGLTPHEIRDRVTEELSKLIRDPNVTVIVEQINSFRVFFLGEVREQGTLQFYRPTTLLQGVAAAGGLTEFSKKDITLVRAENGVEKRHKIDYKRLIAGDPSQPNLLLKAGDTLIFH